MRLAIVRRRHARLPTTSTTMIFPSGFGGSLAGVGMVMRAVLEGSRLRGPNVGSVLRGSECEEAIMPRQSHTKVSCRRQRQKHQIEAFFGKTALSETPGLPNAHSRTDSKYTSPVHPFYAAGAAIVSLATIRSVSTKEQYPVGLSAFPQLIWPYLVLFLSMRYTRWIGSRTARASCVGNELGG